MRSGGSSPRAWGIHLDDAPSQPHRRFIPTCVGNTRFSALLLRIRSVHPHVRGEYPSRTSLSSRPFGSSPRAWGILPGGPQHADHLRFIPTCVGNTSSLGVTRATSSVHPHVRGEYREFNQRVRAGDGSSPRAWGIRVGATDHVEQVRFIPTCVGNTSLCPLRGRRRTVHPHVRGEYAVSNGRSRTSGGSSPRAWGIHDPRPRPRASSRFIPTCVGNTPCLAAPCQTVPVHPLVRGEYYGGPSG